MNHQVLLLSRDAALAERILRALPAQPALELHCEASFRPARDPRGWLLLLLDSRAGAGAVAEVAAQAAAGAAPALLWLSDGPAPAGSGAGTASDETPMPRQVLDRLPRLAPPSKLAFVLHQHLTAAYLQRMRGLPASAATTLLAASGRDALEGQINDTLTGLLGNAQLASQLALDAGRRLPAPLARRLERICDLTVQMRDLMLAYPRAGDAVATPDLRLL